MKHTHILILGSGPAGYSAAIYAARALRQPMLIAGAQPGGQMTITTDVENYPGHAGTIQGPWLMDQMQKQTKKLGTSILYEHAERADLSKRPFRIYAEQNYSCDCLIIATGATAKWLGLPSETRFKGYGVSACATCDGFFYRNKNVAVIGGGNTALEEALFLTNFASKVTLIHRRNSFRGEKILQKQVLEHEKISVLWDTTLEEVLGTDDPPGVSSIKLRNLKNSKISEIDVHGVFIAIGHAPQTSLFDGQLEMDESGYIKTAPDSTATSIPGIYAAGDVADPVYRQAVTAAAMGCMAALEAEKFLANSK